MGIGTAEREKERDRGRTLEGVIQLKKIFALNWPKNWPEMLN